MTHYALLTLWLWYNLKSHGENKVKITQEGPNDCQTVLTIEMEPEDMEKYLDRAYKRLVNRMKVPGFRRGKAPRGILERLIGREALVSEALESLVSGATSDAILNEKLEISAQPQVEILEMDPVILKAIVPLEPVVDLGDYSSVRIPYQDVVVTEDEVNKTLEDIRKDIAPWEPVDRKVKAGDLITADIEAFVGNSKIMDENGAVFIVDPKTSLPFEEFTNHLVGMKSGETNKFSTKVSTDHPNSDIAGETANFSVNLSEIKEQSLPELDDEFASSVKNGEYKDLADLIEKTKEQIRNEMDIANENEHREGVINKLAEGAKIELPELLIEREVENIISRRNEMIEKMKVTKEDYFRFASKTEEQMDGEAKVDAEERLKRSWVLTKLGELENVEVTDEEIETQLNLYKEQSKISKQKIKNRDLERVKLSIKESVFIGKSVDKIIEIAATKSVAAKKKPKTATKKVVSKKKPKNVKSKES